MSQWCKHSANDMRPYTLIQRMNLMEVSFTMTKPNKIAQENCVWTSRASWISRYKPIVASVLV